MTYSGYCTNPGAAPGSQLFEMEIVALGGGDFFANGGIRIQADRAM
jgi:hypothetical protein